MPQGSWDSHPNLTPEQKPQPPLALLYLGVRGTVSGLFQKTDKVTVNRGNRPELGRRPKVWPGWEGHYRKTTSREHKQPGSHERSKTPQAVGLLKLAPATLCVPVAPPLSRMTRHRRPASSFLRA